MAAEAVVCVEGASKKFCGDPRRSLRYAVTDVARDLFLRRRAGSELRRDEFWALRGVSFSVRPGESLGVMGVNGAGKSTLLKLVLGSLRLTEGRIVTRGRVAALSEHGLGFDFALTGRENAYVSAAVLGIERRRVDEALDEIVAVAELEEFIDSPVRSYSSGMRARLGFAVAMHLEPEVLLVDEVLTVGDIGFQRRCIRHVQRFLEAGGSLVLASHNPHLVQSVCDRCLVLAPGVVAFQGEVVEGVAHYLGTVRTDPDDLLALDPALAVPVRRPVADAQTPSFEIEGGAADGERGDEGGKVSIESFGVEPLGPGALRTGEPARVVVRYRAPESLRVRWGFCFLTADLSTTIACDGQLAPFTLPAGRGELVGTLARLPLTGGRYALRVAITDPATDLPFALRGSHSAPRHFSVEMPASRRNNYRSITRELVTLEGLTWEMRDGGRAAAVESSADPSPASPARRAPMDNPPDRE